MRAILLLLAVVSSVSAFCEGPIFPREYVFAKGQAVVTRQGQDAVRKGLRVVLERYDTTLDHTNEKSYALATATTDATGFYVIGGSSLGCSGPHNYRLRLYYDEVATYPLSTIEIPRSSVVYGQPVKVFETDITADYFPPDS